MGVICGWPVDVKFYRGKNGVGDVAHLTMSQSLFYSLKRLTLETVWVFLAYAISSQTAHSNVFSRVCHITYKQAIYGNGTLGWHTLRQWHTRMAHYPLPMLTRFYLIHSVKKPPILPVHMYVVTCSHSRVLESLLTCFYSVHIYIYSYTHIHIFTRENPHFVREGAIRFSVSTINR